MKCEQWHAAGVSPIYWFKNLIHWIFYYTIVFTQIFCYLNKSIFVFILKISQLVCLKLSNFTYTGIDINLSVNVWCIFFSIIT